jgi:hypothetical protein
MNSPDPFDEIGDLLRSHKPDPQPSPGLEARIVGRLVSREPAFIRRAWPWFLLPPAVALGMVLLWPAPPAPLPVVAQDPPPTEAPAVATAEPAVESAPLLANNPLEREKRALQNDARRAGRFLIDCLPSLSVSTD